MDKNYNNDSQRIKRIETMLYLLCLHVGLDPRTGKRLVDTNPPDPRDESDERWRG